MPATSVIARVPQESRAHIIRSDAEALEVVTALSDEFRQDAAKRDRERILPYAEIEKLGQSGFFGICVPREHGGADVSAATVAEAFRLLGAADPSIGQIPQNHFCWLAIIANGTEAQQRFFFERVLAGDRIGNAHSENTKNKPGVHTHDLVRVAGGWRITGRKFYSTGAIFAQWIPFIAADETGASKMFFTAADAKGLEVVDDWNGMGQRTTASGTTIFNDVFVPDEHVFPYSKTEVDAKSFMYNAQLIHTAIDVGIAEEVLGEARRYIHQHNRPWTGNPYDEHAREPFVVAEFGKLSLRVRTAAAMLGRAAAAVDAMRAAPSKQSIIDARLAIADARVVAGEVAVDVSTEFFGITGARATLPQFGLDRHWRNARTHTLHDPLRWKYFHIGNYYLNDVVPEAGTYI
ncbi:SfnB family sulfur acquisition oxidoreductase [Mesorhizobium sp. CN2-181]|uniref:SfnB family sulfur acquisition oxidoreductase n=1 Tax=Mesorhizobium yinganensis TaxID=3157707 RepID=UPI0032B861B3